MDVKLSDELNGYDAEGKVGTMREAAAWLSDEACKHYPDSGFSRNVLRLRLIGGYQ